MVWKTQQLARKALCGIRRREWLGGHTYVSTQEDKSECKVRLGIEHQGLPPVIPFSCEAPPPKVPQPTRNYGSITGPSIHTHEPRVDTSHSSHNNLCFPSFLATCQSNCLYISLQSRDHLLSPA